MSPRSSRTLAIGFAGLGLVGALAGCSSTASADTNTGSSTGTSTGTSSGSTATASASYKDGTYTEDGSYQSPSGTESITVKLTLKSDKVTAVTVTPHATSGNPQLFQSQFASSISGLVVGKDIDTLSVSRVAGSSLTSGGFNAAVTSIKADALAS